MCYICRRVCVFQFTNFVSRLAFCSVHHFGRAVIMFGVPYVYTQSRILKVRTIAVSSTTTCTLKKIKNFNQQKSYLTDWAVFSIVDVEIFPSPARFRLAWSTCGITFRSERMTFWRLMPCATPPSVLAEPSEARQTTDSWFLLTRCVMTQSCIPHSTEGLCVQSVCVYVTSVCVPPTALRPSRQTWETSSLDSGAHQWRQSEPDSGWSRPAVQALPASDGSAFQTGAGHTYIMQ